MTPRQRVRRYGQLEPAGIPDVVRHADIACRPEVGAKFFPDTMGESNVRQAKKMCRRCPHTAECLAWALRTGEPDGVWGGLTPKEREDLMKKGTLPRAS